MARYARTVFAVILLAAGCAGTAAAEATISLNDNNTGVFDQPSVVMDGSVARVAFLGDNTGSGTYRVFYAALNGAANFSALTLARDNTVLLTPPVVVDNTGAGGNSPYFDARHPKIALRTATEVAIVFQAKPLASDIVYRPYIARIALSGNTAALASVKAVTGFPAGILSTGDIEDVSFGIVASDNSARIAFAAKSSIPGTDLFQVYFARVGLDNALVTGTPLRLSSAGNEGTRPIPALKIDALNREHVAWASIDDSPDTRPVYYAMVKETNGVDNLVIAATQVIGGSFRWGHANLLVPGSSSILVLAGEESAAAAAGTVGLVHINPDADNQDGTPVQVATNTAFFLTPPGELILPDEFRLFRPESFLDPSGRIHMTGYGTGGARCTYYVFRLIATFPYYEILTPRTQAGFASAELPAGIAGDYAKAAIGYLSGKALVFWSGEVSPGTNRNLDATGIPTVTEPIPFSESGCSMVRAPRTGEAGRIPGTALLFLPAVLLAARRIRTRVRPARSKAVAK